MITKKYRQRGRMLNPHPPAEKSRSSYIPLRSSTYNNNNKKTIKHIK